MNSEPFKRPDEVLRQLIAAGVELVYVRDPALAARLDVAPPSVDPGDHLAPQMKPKEGRGIAYRIARKIYRKLKNNQQLKPLLDRVRHEILTRT